MLLDFSFLGAVEFEHVLQALHDDRVRHALERALLDGAVRREFRAMRAEGVKVQEAVEALADRYACSEETIRTIIYNKRRRQARGQRG